MNPPISIRICWETRLGPLTGRKMVAAKSCFASPGLVASYERRALGRVETERKRSTKTRPPFKHFIFMLVMEYLLIRSTTFGISSTPCFSVSGLVGRTWKPLFPGFFPCQEAGSMRVPVLPSVFSTRASQGKTDKWVSEWGGESYLRTVCLCLLMLISVFFLDVCLDGPNLAVMNLIRYLLYCTVLLYNVLRHSVLYMTCKRKDYRNSLMWQCSPPSSSCPYTLYCTAHQHQVKKVEMLIKTNANSNCITARKHTV